MKDLLPILEQIPTNKPLLIVAEEVERGARDVGRQQAARHAQVCAVKRRATVASPARGIAILTGS